MSNPNKRMFSTSKIECWRCMCRRHKWHNSNSLKKTNYKTKTREVYAVKVLYIYMYYICICWIIKMRNGSPSACERGLNYIGHWFFIIVNPRFRATVSTQLRFINCMPKTHVPVITHMVRARLLSPYTQVFACYYIEERVDIHTKTDLHAR